MMAVRIRGKILAYRVFGSVPPGGGEYGSEWCHRPPQAATGCHRTPQVATGRHRSPQATTDPHRPPPAAILFHDIYSLILGK